MVKFICTSNSNSLSITGNIPELGSWNYAIPMHKNGNKFEAEIILFGHVEYKYKIQDKWEDNINNRICNISNNSIIIYNEWDSNETHIEDYLYTSWRKFAKNQVFDDYTDYNNSGNLQIVSGYTNKYGTKVGAYYKNNKVEVDGYFRGDTYIEPYVRRKTTKQPVSSYTKSNGTKVRAYSRKRH